jgi:hypothetical protein
MFILFFKTPSIKDRNYFAKIFQTKEEAEQERAILLKEGRKGEPVIYTNIKEGIK